MVVIWTGIGIAELAVFGLLAACACWNVLVMRKTGPVTLLKRCDELTEFVGIKLTSFERRVAEMEASDAIRAVSAQKLKSEFIDLLDQQDEVLERTDQKRRRIDAAESRASKREQLVPGGTPAYDPNDVNAVRAMARANGMIR